MTSEAFVQAAFAPCRANFRCYGARSMPLYDLMLLLDPTAPSDRHEAIMAEVQKLIESGGKVVGVHDWGSRKMAFEIDHRPEAAYHLIQFETDAGGALLESVDHSLKITDGVLRHRIIKLKDGMPPPPMPRPEGRREAPADAPEGVTNGREAAAAPAVDAPVAPAEDAPVAPAEDAPVAPADAGEPTPAPPPAEEAAAPAAEPLAEIPPPEPEAVPAAEGDEEAPPVPPAAA
jgi:small subunit ribosomal protein S6